MKMIAVMRVTRLLLIQPRKRAYALRTDVSAMANGRKCKWRRSGSRWIALRGRLKCWRGSRWASRTVLFCGLGKTILHRTLYKTRALICSPMALLGQGEYTLADKSIEPEWQRR